MKDWVIAKWPGGRYLDHIHHFGDLQTSHTCYWSERASAWACYDCGGHPPKEIEFCAELANCERISMRTASGV